MKWLEPEVAQQLVKKVEHSNLQCALPDIFLRSSTELELNGERSSGLTLVRSSGSTHVALCPLDVLVAVCLLTG